MKINKLYVCEICNNKSEDKDIIKKCEDGGHFNEKMYPDGLMFRYLHSKYVGIFAIMGASVSDNPHLGRADYMACRVNSMPTMCNGELLTNDIENWVKYHKIPAEQTVTPEFDKLVAHLKSMGIKPSYYNENSEYVQL